MLRADGSCSQVWPGTSARNCQVRVSVSSSGTGSDIIKQYKQTHNGYHYKYQKLYGFNDELYNNVMFVKYMARFLNRRSIQFWWLLLTFEAWESWLISLLLCWGLAFLLSGAPVQTFILILLELKACWVLALWLEWLVIAVRMFWDFFFSVKCHCWNGQVFGRLAGRVWSCSGISLIVNEIVETNGDIISHTVREYFTIFFSQTILRYNVTYLAKQIRR